MRCSIVAFAALLALLAIPTASSFADDGRWGGTSKGGPSGTPDSGEGPPIVAGRRPGWKILQVGQKVSATMCEANPVSCICPPDSVKVEFFESQGWGKLSQKTLSCIPAYCPPGQIMRKRTAAAGQVSFKCEKPKS